MILDEIIRDKIVEVENRKKEFPLENFHSKITKSTKDFKKSLLAGHGINLIAEVKRKSPSKGKIQPDADIFHVVKIYDQNPLVNAISFLTDYKYFGGKAEEMLQISLQTTKPVIRKDFIIDEYQIYEARYFGADAILLIASVLSTDQMENFINIAKSMQMDCLVEVHNEEEIEKLPPNVEIGGINNRNLKDFTISLETTKKLAKQLKKKCQILVSESGINTAEDVRYISDFSDAILVGTAIMKEENIHQKINSLFVPRVKICGITRLNDALYCANLGVNFLGFIFYKKSKRYISPTAAETIISEIKEKFPMVQIVGVFVNEQKQEVLKIKEKCGLDLVQLHGEEEAEYYSDIRNIVIKSFRVEDNLNEYQANLINASKAKYILLDTYAKDAYGGTGASFNWKILRDIKHKNLFLAGGLNDENFINTLKFKPDILDINSGVETAPGEKDSKKIQTIMNQLKAL